MDKKERQRQYAREHYKRNRQYYIDKAMRKNRALIEEVRRLKEVPCTDCGQQYAYYVMDFDHLDDKTDNINTLIRNYGRARVLAEIAKCEVVCSNCHRIRTHMRCPGGEMEITAVYGTAIPGSTPG